MIYEIATISSFIILGIIFILSTFLYEEGKKNKKGSIRKDAAPILQKKISVIKTLLLIFISLLLFDKLVIFLFAPDTILKYHPISPVEINQLIITFFYTVFWIIILFAFLTIREVKDDYKMVFLKKLSIAVIVLFLLDFCLTGIVYAMNITYYFNITMSIPAIQIHSSESHSAIILITVLLLTIVLSVMFFVFIFKRKIRILSYYELTILLLLSVVGYLLITHTSQLLGWNESEVFRLKLFSFQYGYVGLIFFFLLAVTLITNSFVILLFTLKEIFINSMMIKNKIVNYMKIGFISTITLCGLAVMPHFILWFY